MNQVDQDKLRILLIGIADQFAPEIVSEKNKD
jgi:hypothetical protein